MISINCQKESSTSSKFNNIQKEVPDLPSFLITPIFNEDSSWPSYLIKPIYDNNKININYNETMNTLANNINSYGHKTYITHNGIHMFPTMPYYTYANKVSEIIPQVVYPYSNIFYNNQNIGIPVVPMLTPILKNNVQKN